MAYSVLDIAKKLIWCARFDVTDGGDLMTNLKLQKMLYYEQGHYLAKFGNPLFDEDIEAWMYGPVVPCVYNAYENYKDNGIDIVVGSNDIIGLDTDEEEDFFINVYEHYRNYSAYALANKTHDEYPWKSVKRHGKGIVIEKHVIKEFFENMPLK